MCIIIYKPLKTTIPKIVLQNCFLNNNDGAGYMYASGGEVIVRKGFFVFTDFWKSYEKHSHESDMVIHFRISTQGSISKKNCHPFYINTHLGFAHNGILDIDVAKGSKRSDTNQFNFEILKKLPDNFLDNPAVMTLIEEFIGTDKLIFLDSKGKVTIVNETAGEWSKNTGGERAWFSNGSFRWKTTYHGYDFSSYGGVVNHGVGTGLIVGDDDINDFNCIPNSDKYDNHSKKYEDIDLCKCDWCCNTFDESYVTFYLIDDDMVCQTCYDIYENALPIDSEKSVVRLYKTKESISETAPTIEAQTCIVGNTYILYARNTSVAYTKLAMCEKVSITTNSITFKLLVSNTFIYTNNKTLVGLLDSNRDKEIKGFGDTSNIRDDIDNIVLFDGNSKEYLKDTPGVYTLAKYCIVGKMYIVHDDICRCTFNTSEAYVVVFHKENGEQIFAEVDDEVILIGQTDLTEEDYETLFSEGVDDVGILDDDDMGILDAVKEPRAEI